VADEYVSVPGVSDADAFAARVVGDSMNPEYAEGDIVVFSPAAPVRPGSDCFVRFERDAETTFKRVAFERGGDGREWIVLEALNPRYEARRVEREAVAGMYAAVYVIRPI
ncbi:MAG: S24 family peptidase, partial [Phycisphaerales bacterium]|nr:S24 family peptidase [Phycisphaerales bacterium]